MAQYRNNEGVTLFEIGMYKAKEGNDKEANQYYKSASVAYKTAIELDSTAAEYHYNLSKALFAMSDIDEAISECKTALLLNPDKVEYHSFYSYCLLQKRAYGEALSEAQKALELATD